MKKLLLAGLAAAFFGHAQWAFSESRTLRWIESHERAVFDMQEGVCKHFTHDVRVDIVAKTPKGEWQVEGGKEEVCDYVRAANAQVRVLMPELNTRTELLSLQQIAELTLRSDGGSPR